MKKCSFVKAGHIFLIQKPVSEFYDVSVIKYQICLIEYSRCPHKQFLNPFFDCYINEYCANYLTKLGIAFKGDLFNNFTKPFPNVEDFFFRSCDLNGQKIKLSNWLPKLRSLRILECSLFFFTTDPLPRIPNLEHLAMKIDYQIDFNAPEFEDLRETNVYALLESHSMLRSLDLSYCPKAKA